MQVGSFKWICHFSFGVRQLQADPLRESFGELRVALVARQESREIQVSMVSSPIPRGRQLGVTLVEISVALALGSIAVLIAATLFSNSKKLASKTQLAQEIYTARKNLAATHCRQTLDKNSVTSACTGGGQALIAYSLVGKTIPAQYIGQIGKFGNIGTRVWCRGTKVEFGFAYINDKGQPMLHPQLPKLKADWTNKLYPNSFQGMQPFSVVPCPN